MKYTRLMCVFLMFRVLACSLCCHAIQYKETRVSKSYLVSVVRNSKKLRAFFTVIGYAEGTDRRYRYRTLFSGKKIKDLSDHPRTVVCVQSNGNPLRSSAAGRYQIKRSVWDTLAKRLGLRSFSPLDQDIAAAELLREIGALDDILHDRFADAVTKSCHIWASFPGAPYGQRTVSLKELELVYLMDLKLQ